VTCSTGNDADCNPATRPLVPTQTCAATAACGSCTVLHPIGVFVQTGPGNSCQCAEFFAAPGTGGSSSTWANGEERVVRMSYCSGIRNGVFINHGYGSALFKCENGSFRQIGNGTCHLGAHEP
jgi:hypothetical protein